MRSGAHALSSIDRLPLLTDREKEVLQLLAERRSNKEVATLLDRFTPF